tara:strand:+ start:1552 stop:1704 length:153 start_codon:yes stop_codon:yes gene_type:complete
LVLVLVPVAVAQLAADLVVLAVVRTPRSSTLLRPPDLSLELELVQVAQAA